jgi:hypothetical protein
MILVTEQPLWQSFVGPAIALLALLFTIGSFWWLQARQGKLRSYRPHTFALIHGSSKVRLRFPLVFYNTGAKPIVIRDMRLTFPGQPGIEPLPWRTFRSQLKPDTDDGERLPAVFSVPGRQAQQQFIEFGVDRDTPLPGVDFAIQEHTVQVEVLLGHKKAVEAAGCFPATRRGHQGAGPLPVVQEHSGSPTEIATFRLSCFDRYN